MEAKAEAARAAGWAVARAEEAREAVGSAAAATEAAARAAATGEAARVRYTYCRLGVVLVRRCHIWARKGEMQVVRRTDGAM